MDDKLESKGSVVLLFSAVGVGVGSIAATRSVAALVSAVDLLMMGRRDRVRCETEAIF